MGNGVVKPCAVSAVTSGSGRPSAANVGMPDAGAVHRTSDGVVAPGAAAAGPPARDRLRAAPGSTPRAAPGCRRSTPRVGAEPGSPLSGRRRRFGAPERRRDCGDVTQYLRDGHVTRRAGRARTRRCAPSWWRQRMAGRSPPPYGSARPVRMQRSCDARRRGQRSARICHRDDGSVPLDGRPCADPWSRPRPADPDLVEQLVEQRLRVTDGGRQPARAEPLADAPHVAGEVLRPVRVADDVDHLR